MSRQAVGDVYAKVIVEVCKQSRPDFEDGGVDESVLELLKTVTLLACDFVESHTLLFTTRTHEHRWEKVDYWHKHLCQQTWQQKLSQLKVAQLPWDPTPPTPAVPSNAPPPSNTKPPPQTLPSNANSISTPPSSHSTPGAQVKQEHSAYPSQAPPPTTYAPINFPPGARLDARQRAAMNLHNAYGPQAGPQISQLQQGNIPRMAPPSSMNNVKEEDRKPNLSTMPEYVPQQLPSVPIKTSQNDGAGDSLTEWNDEVARRREAAVQNGGRADQLMRERFEDTQSRMEGGGLMLPLAARRRPNRPSKDGSSGLRGGVVEMASGEPCLTTHSLVRAQGDAAADDENTPEADEDAINSDLDDPDDRADDVENEENTDQVMLCTYDKVARVKNKWKCTLKDAFSASIKPNMSFIRVRANSNGKWGNDTGVGRVVSGGQLRLATTK